MATKAHCAYCFESLVSSFEQRQPLSLKQVQELWAEYAQEHNVVDTEEEDDDDDTENTSTGQDKKPTNISISTSQSKPESHPLFVTWNTISGSNQKILRGCIGTFSPQDLSTGLRSYALTSAFDDHRFSPIPASLLHRLQCSVTLLTNFSAPDKDPMNWTIGKHGLRISFSHHGRRYGATYLPDVAREQGWNKEEALVSLMRKAGWNGRKEEWRKMQGLEIVRYEGKKIALEYNQWRQWRDWVQEKGVTTEALN